MSERTSAIQFSSVPNLAGGYDVKESFAEFLIPLVVEKPAVDSLAASLAWRWADYKGSGSIIAWKGDRKSTRLNSSHVKISYAVFCLKKKKKKYSMSMSSIECRPPVATELSRAHWSRLQYAIISE